MRSALITAEIIGKEAALTRFERLGKHGLIGVLSTSLERDFYRDGFILKLETVDESVTDFIPSNALLMSLADFSAKVIKPMVERFPSVQRLKLREAKIRRMKAKSVARTWEAYA